MFRQTPIVYHDRGVHHTPGAVSQGRLLDNQEGASANTEPYVFGKFSTRNFQRRAFWHRHYSNFGYIDHGKSAQGDVSIRRDGRMR